MSNDVTRRGALMVVGLVGCSNDQDAAVAGDDSDEFDFAGSPLLGQVIAEGERQSAPAFSGELLDESTFESTALADDIAVLDFWGSWCAPCRLETPEFQTVYADVRDAGVRFRGIDVKDQRQLARAFVDFVGVEYPSTFDPRGEVALAFRGFPASVVPTTILLDRSNRVAAVYIAAVSEDDSGEALDHLLAEGTPG